MNVTYTYAYEFETMMITFDTLIGHNCVGLRTIPAVIELKYSHPKSNYHPRNRNDYSFHGLLL